jgi:hypothetical protein
MKILIGFFILIFILINCKSSEVSISALPYDPPGATITADKEISVQHKRTISFSSTEIFASNEFPGARLNDFYQLNDTTYVAVIEPENAPINDSPWYSFKIWSKKNQKIILNLTYKNGTHRYKPKLSYDGNEWQPIDSLYVSVDTTINQASLRLELNKDTIWISSQELITYSNYEDWINQLLKRKFVRKDIIGSSSQGKPIAKLEIGDPENKNFIFLIGRNHPPEVTGYFALKSFVEAIALESDIAKEFRKNFTTVIIPLVNPDGVDNGHWRHNYKGVDLNRDWISFNQPEPRSVKTEVEKIISSGRPIRFFIDFHSTQQDVFYILSYQSIVSDDLSNKKLEKRKYAYNLIDEWLKNIQLKLPKYRVNIIDTLSNPFSPTSDRWIMREYDAPALTYEVGDETERDLIKNVAETASTELMRLLLKEDKTKIFNSDN